MAGGLELAQLLEHDDVAEVDVRRRRVDAELDAQRPSLGEALGELAVRQHVDGAEGRAGCAWASNPAGRAWANARLSTRPKATERGIG